MLQAWELIPRADVVSLQTVRLSDLATSERDAARAQILFDFDSVQTLLDSLYSWAPCILQGYPTRTSFMGDPLPGGLDDAVVIQIEVLEGFGEDCLLRLRASGLFGELVL